MHLVIGLKIQSLSKQTDRNLNLYNLTIKKKNYGHHFSLFFTKSVIIIYRL